MTEINFVEPTKNKRRTRRTQIASKMRIDMTPMVDLGFLLITFFVFTTEISRPAVTKLYMPHDDIKSGVADSKSMTVLLNSSHEVFYYFGLQDDALRNQRVRHTSYDESDGLGKVIREKQTELEKRNIDKKELVVLIKPGTQSSYNDLVAVLNEMLINGVTRFAIADQEKEETAILRRIH